MDITYSALDDDTIEAIVCAYDRKATEGRAELARRKAATPAVDMNVRRLGLANSVDGTVSAYADEFYFLRVWPDCAKRQGRDPARLAREIDLAPCMADYLEMFNDDLYKVGVNRDQAVFWLIRELGLCNSGHTDNDTSAAIAAGWIPAEVQS